MLQRTRRTLTANPHVAKRGLAGAVSLLVLALLPATSHGAERRVASGAGARPAPNTSPTDFHIQLKSDTPMTWFGQPRLWQNLNDLGPPAQQDPGPARTLDLEWSPIQGSPNDNFEWVLEFTQREYNKYDIKTWFTPRQSPTDWPQLGWEVDAGGSVTLRILAFRHPVLRFAVPVPRCHGNDGPAGAHPGHALRHSRPDDIRRGSGGGRRHSGRVVRRTVQHATRRVPDGPRRHGL